MGLDYGVDIIGPVKREDYTLTLDGYKIPHLVLGVDENGAWSMTVDGRFYVSDLSRDEINRWTFIIANAMAVSAGYSSHGEHSQKRNLFKCQVGRMTNGDS